jgi:tetratricopeptide (TPR) repeat protein
MEYLHQEEERLAHARQTLGFLVQRPKPTQAHVQPAFGKRSLRRALRRMGWGWRWQAEKNVAAAATRGERQVDLARRLTSIHEKERALAHLLLGAIADARSDHQAAFTEFEKVLQLDEGDMEALEYAGLQLLKLGNALGAADHFARLETKALERGDRLLLARAYRQHALACEHCNSHAQANSLLLSALAAYPSNTDPLELAYTHEQHGRARRKAGFANANQSLQEAMLLFSGIGRTGEARDGVARINRAIRQLNEEWRDAPKGNGAAPTSPAETA